VGEGKGGVERSVGEEVCSETLFLNFPAKCNGYESSATSARRGKEIETHLANISLTAFSLGINPQTLIE